MKIIWAPGAETSRAWLYPREQQADVGIQPNGSSLPTRCADLVVVASSPGARPSLHSGLRWLQRFRRETRSLAPALVYSFETRESLSRLFTFLAGGTPGIGFMRLPFTRTAFEKELDKLEPLTPEQLHDLLRWHCGLQEEWQARAHETGNTLQGWPAQRSRTRRIVAEWGPSIREFAPDQVNALSILDQALDEEDDSIRAALQRLDQGLQLRPAVARPDYALGDAWAPEPPPGFDSIGIADDCGYEPATIAALRRLGYRVFEVARNLDQARALLQNARPRVMLTDLNFPLAGDGLELMQLALATPSVRLVVAISHALAPERTLPPEVEDCCGGQDFQDAARIHNVIWRRARASGDR